MLRTLLAAALIAAPIPAVAQEEAAEPKNIIVMIADGAGYNMLAAARYWTGAPLTADSQDWQRASLATYALRRDREPLGNEQNGDIAYDSEANWDAETLAGESACATGYPAGFAGYEWNRCSYPDSANTMSAMMTGVRTYNGAINVDGMATPVRSLAEAANEAGWRVGSISTVPFSHATVAAGGGAHNPDRGEYHAIAQEMLESDTLDFIAGGGNPDFDGDGKPVETGAADAERFRWISPKSWAALQQGTSGWTLVETRADIQALAESKREGRVIVLPQVGSTMQVERSAPGIPDVKATAPGEVAKLPTVPTLAEMTRAALAHLQSPEGMFLQVEGGAVDWAMHGNMLGRAIEEYEDFDAAVRAVTGWVEDPSNGSTWNNTLVIVTADHDHLLFGPDADVPFQPVENRGAGTLPGHRWWSGSHSNQLVPFFVRGAGADRFIAAADKEDHAIINGEAVGRGRYLTQPEMGQILLDFAD